MNKKKGYKVIIACIALVLITSFASFYITKLISSSGADKNDNSKQNNISSNSSGNQPVSKLDPLRLLSSGEVDIFEFSMGDSIDIAVQKLGKPKDFIAWYGGNIVSYDKFGFITDEYNESKPSGNIAEMCFSEGAKLYGITIGMKPKEIIKKLGNPDTEGIAPESNEEYGDKWTTIYKRGRYKLVFVSDNKDSSTTSAFLQLNKSDSSDLSNKVNTISDKNKITKFLSGNNTLNTLISNLGMDNTNINQIIYCDIDKDGNDEYIISQNYEKNYVIKKINNNYNSIGALDGNIATVSAIKIVKLDNTGIQYIYVEQKNDDGGLGSLVYKVAGSSLKIIDNSFPATGKGTRILRANKNSGYYEKVDIQQYNDYQNHLETTNYKWNGHQFSKLQTIYSYPNNKDDKFKYPDKPEDVVRCFIEANYLNIVDELYQLTSGSSKIKGTFLNDFCSDGRLFSDGLTLQTDLLNKISDTEAVYKASEDDNEAYFILVKQNDGWKVKSVSQNLN